MTDILNDTAETGGMPEIAVNFAAYIGRTGVEPARVNEAPAAPTLPTDIFSIFMRVQSARGRLEQDLGIVPAYTKPELSDAERVTYLERLRSLREQEAELRPEFEEAARSRQDDLNRTRPNFS